MFRVWSEQWKAPDEWLRAVEERIRAEDVAVQRGGDFDTWDFQIRGGFAGVVRLTLAIEEHGAGKQMLLFRLQPRVTPLAKAALILVSLISAFAFIDGSVRLGVVLAVGVLAVLYRMITDCTVGAATVQHSLESLKEGSSAPDEAAATVVYLGSS